MQRYIGLDVHSTSCTFVVVGPTGRRMQTAVVETNGPALIQFLQTVPGERHLCFEEGTQSQWLYEILIPHVDRIVVAGLGTRKRLRQNKSDRQDAHALAEQLRLGGIDTPVFKGFGEFGKLRELVRVYVKVVQDVTRTKNRLKAVFRSRGIATPKGIYTTPDRKEWLSTLPTRMREPTRILFEMHDALARIRGDAEKALLTEARRHRPVSLLRTCPGIGELRAAMLVAIIVTPRRFRTKRQLWSYAGLAVVTRSSADWIQSPDGRWERSRRPMPRGLNRNYNRTLKAIFKGAATTLLRYYGHDPLAGHYEKMLADGVKPNLAKLTVARKIAAVIHVMWKEQEVYAPNRVRRAQQSFAP